MAEMFYYYACNLVHFVDNNEPGINDSSFTIMTHDNECVHMCVCLSFSLLTSQSGVFQLALIGCQRSNIQAEEELWDNCIRPTGICQRLTTNFQVKEELAHLTAFPFCFSYNQKNVASFLLKA